MTSERGLPFPSSPHLLRETSFGRAFCHRASFYAITIKELVSSGGNTSLFTPLVIFLVTLLVAFLIIIHVTFLVVFYDHNLCQSQSHLLCPHPFIYLIIFQVSYRVTFLINSLFTFFSFPCHFPILILCHILPGDMITARWLAYGHKRSTFVYAHTLPWVFNLGSF